MFIFVILFSIIPWTFIFSKCKEENFRSEEDRKYDEMFDEYVYDFEREIPSMRIEGTLKIL